MEPITKIDFMPHPLTTENRSWIEGYGGQTLSEAIGPIGPSIAVVNGKIYRQHEWHRIVLNRDDVIQVRAIMLGGEGSNPLAIVLSIATLTLAAPFAASLAAKWGITSQIGTALLTSLIGLSGILIINAIFPPRLPNIKGAAETQRQYSISGGSNAERPFESILLVLGKHRVFPDLASRPYTDFGDNNDQFLYQIFDFGIGDLDITDVQIGETPIGDYTDVTIDQSTNSRQGKTILKTDFIHGNVDTLPGGELGYQAGSVTTLTRTTASGTVQLAVDIVVIHFRAQDDGSLEGQTTKVEISYTNQTGTVTGNQTVEIRSPDGAEARQAVRRSFYYPVTEDTYTIRVAPVEPYAADADLSRVTVQLQCGQIRAYQPSQADFTGRNPYGLRIKATGQLYGRVESLNAICGQKVGVLSGGSWSKTVSSNPGFIGLQWCRGFYADGKLIAGMGLPDDRIDIDSFVQFATFCDDNSFEFNAVLSDDRDRFDILTLILQAGWGSIDRQTGKWGVLWEDTNHPMSSLITPDSVIAGTMSIKYDHEGLADEIIGSFLDSSNDWQPTPIRRLIPGVSTPNTPAQINLEGVTNGVQAAKVVNQMVAANFYHRRATMWEMDIDEARFISRGDVVGISHGLIGNGFGGRMVDIDSTRRIVRVNNIPDTNGSIWVWDLEGDITSGTYTKGSDNSLTLSFKVPDPPAYIEDQPLAYRYMCFPQSADVVKLRVTSKEPAGQGKVRILCRDEVQDYYNFRTADLSWAPVDVVKSSLTASVGQLTVYETDVGIRVFDWQEHPSPNIIGYQLRYGGTTQDFAEMKPMHEGTLTATYYESADRPPKGTYRFGLIAVFGDGRVSEPSYATFKFGDIIQGLDGQDGNGYEYVFTATADPTIPNNQRPSNSWGFDSAAEVNGLTWYDGLANAGFSADKPYLWQALRKVEGVPAKGAAVTDEWDPPAIVARWGVKGDDGQPGLDGVDGANGTDGVGVEYVFQVTSTVTRPAGPSNSWAYDAPESPWFDAAPNLSDTNPYLWRSQRKIRGENTVDGRFTTPVIVGRYGIDGVKGLDGIDGSNGSDGTGKEFIFARTSTTTPPTLPSNSWPFDSPQPPWTDAAPNLTSTIPYLWMAQRKIRGENTVISGSDGAWSAPVIVGRWGPQGIQGPRGLQGNPVSRSGLYDQIDFIFAATRTGSCTVRKSCDGVRGTQCADFAGTWQSLDRYLVTNAQTLSNGPNGEKRIRLNMFPNQECLETSVARVSNPSCNLGSYVSSSPCPRSFR